MHYLSFLSIVLFPVAGLAGTLADLGDLNIDGSRVPRWYPALESERGYLAAQEWPEYDVTCANAPCGSGKLGFKDAPGNPMSSCAAANAADDGGEDWSQINCMVDRAPDSSVVYVPAGIYDMGDANGEVISISRSNVVLRGAGITQTHLRIAHTSGGKGFIGSANCADSVLPSNTNCGAGVVSVGTRYEGSSVSWTAGYEEEDTVVTVSNASSFSKSGWIMLGIPDAATDCKFFLPEAVKSVENMARALGHIAKITAINGNNITIDRGLRMDYTAEPGCADSAIARPFNSIRWVGIEAIHFVTAPAVNPDDLKTLGFATLGAGTVESWAVGNKFERAESRIFMFRVSARNWFQGNLIANYGRIDTHFNTSGVTNSSNAVDNVLENNAWKDFVVGVYNLKGAEGIVMAYNYLRHGNPPNSPERGIFNHGLYTREMLMEGNDSDATIVVADHWWGSNGPRITAYRNRIVGTGPRASLTVNHDKSGPWIIADRINWVGNTADSYFSSAWCASNFPDCLNGAHDFDGTSSDSYARVTNMHVERNMYRNVDTCKGDPTPGRCGFHQDSSQPDTSCGTASGPGDCSGGTGSNAGGDSAPSSWVGEQVPHSLYRLSSEPPIWWCQEACAWSDVHSGIGAWGDDFDGGLCMLPAEILSNGGPCTPVGNGPGAAPAAPVLLP